ncbi:hypothetical protein COEREDRAFT_88515 [Coemansia reversa NRRL 1564]|uniref:Uncharacterized protein n=1 Tax=Coemansia reversa (strain ATCC 12441 / NRRL 1564) TaxID=763665 RepID=A0A2G5B6Q6_COERN|nr:hypothetical protein COEREDRAFT_88515 [Coemansia reversa NRRL 1564]|eukprot:PIA14696.1 hypothetical protein COEREDRAFT_88515 [Coemansia reversa NRRL 1564]
MSCANPDGMYCLVDCNVLSNSVLSGFSALLCCAVLTTIKANGKVLAQEDTVELAVASERLIGTDGSDMDQTTSIMSQPQSAIFIEFEPVPKITPVNIPSAIPPIAFVITNTLVVSDKAVTAPVCYNLWVVET